MMFKTLAKSFFNPSGNSYKLLSYFYNYSNKKYLPKKIDNINKILENLSTANSVVNFIQVGSNDGVSGDPINYFVNNYNWQGVLVEPIPFLYEKLKINYDQRKENLQFLNCAVSAEEEKYKQIYVINEKYRNILPDWYYQLGSFYREVLYHHEIPNIDNYIVSQEVLVCTLQNIIDKNMQGKCIDFLHIDAEGYDLEILNTLNFTETLPKVILSEFINLDVANRKQMISLLQANQYKVYRHNQDYISLHNTVHDLYMHGTHVFPFWE